ncbi:hypothetical protein P43SY_011567 [Pythium insidiosum]|uniref:Uncharacterized protein n=1 Tax=Pythium insidiosum TaxID=114742 RepID=A0AAD5LSM4_PYTIN|nr:hypothetical protein P43SY_011567 [Pythium insidiosum]
MSDYESFSSDESDDGEDGTEDEDVAPFACDYDEEDHLSKADAAMMDGAFVQSLQVGADGRSNEAVKARESALRSMQWTPVSSAFEVDVPAYIGLTEVAGQLRGVLRRPGKDAGKRKRTRRELQLAGDEGDEEGGESGSDDEWEMPEEDAAGRNENDRSKNQANN